MNRIENTNESKNKIDVTVLDYCGSDNKEDREEDIIRRRMTSI